MKKIILLLALSFGLSQTTNAQLNFGIKGGINYNNNGDVTFSSAGNDVINGAKSKSGFHAGLWFRGKIPVLGLYLRPEVVYTQVKSEYLYKGTNTAYDFKKIDVPVLLGTKFLGFVNAFAGPSFQYIIDDNFKFSNLSTDDFNKFSVGVQMGFGVEFGALGIDARWERSFSDSEVTFIDGGSSVKIDNRTNQIIFGVSIRL